jgi:hypothetical protein
LTCLRTGQSKNVHHENPLTWTQIHHPVHKNHLSWKPNWNGISAGSKSKAAACKNAKNKIRHWKKKKEKVHRGREYNYGTLPKELPPNRRKNKRRNNNKNMVEKHTY